MNIIAAAVYLKVGYRIRRPHWEPEEYISECADMLEKQEVREYGLLDESGYHKERGIHNDWNYGLRLSDLLADDWEIITAGIRKQFNKHGNFEYEDEEDWDNYDSSMTWFEE